MTLREAPLSHLQWLEKLLRRGTVCAGILGRSQERFKASLQILATPGRDPTIIHNESHCCTNRYEGVEWLSEELKVHPGGPDADNREAGPACASSSNENSEWVKLQKAMLNLPLDVDLLIRDSLHEEIFGPGKEIVFPNHDPSYLRHFRALDRDSYQKYHSILYSKNMWVIKEGPADPIFQYAKDIIYQSSQIKNLTLKWTRRDYEKIQLGIEQFIDFHIEKGGADGMDNTRAVYDFSAMCDIATWELKSTWCKKLEKVSMMNLDSLTIDARDAFAPDGEYLGLSNARDLALEIPLILPKDLRVLAPGDVVARQIHDVIVAKNW